MVIAAWISAAAASTAPATASTSTASARAPRDFAMPERLDLRRQAELRDAWLVKRLDTVVPMLMRREGVDIWVLIAREYMEDPVVRTMLPSTWLSARRRTVLVFHDPGPGKPIQKLSLSRYPPGEWFTTAWTPEDEPDQWQRLAKVIAERDPRRIAVSLSQTFPLADGLTATELQSLRAALGEPYASRLVSGERLSIGWLETRIPEEIAFYPTVVRIANAIIAEGFSERVITPGVTTTTDLQWWFRERISALGLSTWFHPTVGIQRAEAEVRPMTTMFASKRPDLIIQPGDLLHVDIGIVYLGLATDTQNHAYVLRPGETDAPAGLKAGLTDANRVQDFLMKNFRAGESGNALLARARAEALAAGLAPTIYSHALGFHGHGAGPWIGMWDNQNGGPGPGEYPVQPDTVWAIELNAERAVPEWGGRKIRFMLEEDAFFDGRGVRFLDGRQQAFHLIPRR